MEFTDILKRLRAELGLTQMELANALHVNYSTVGRWENGRTLPNRSIMALLIDFARVRAVSSDCLQALEACATQLAKDRLLSANGPLGTVERTSLGQLIEDASFPLYVCDMETDELLYLNREARRMLDGELSELQSRKCYECLMHRDAPCEFCHKNELV